MYVYVNVDCNVYIQRERERKKIFNISEVFVDEKNAYEKNAVLLKT